MKKKIYIIFFIILLFIILGFFCCSSVKAVTGNMKIEIDGSTYDFSGVVGDYLLFLKSKTADNYYAYSFDTTVKYSKGTTRLVNTVKNAEFNYNVYEEAKKLNFVVASMFRKSSLESSGAYVAYFCGGNFDNYEILLCNFDFYDTDGNLLYDYSSIKDNEDDKKDDSTVSVDLSSIEEGIGLIVSFLIFFSLVIILIYVYKFFNMFFTI